METPGGHTYEGVELDKELESVIGGSGPTLTFVARSVVLSHKLAPIPSETLVVLPPPPILIVVVPAPRLPRSRHDHFKRQQVRGAGSPSVPVCLCACLPRSMEPAHQFLVLASWRGCATAASVSRVYAREFGVSVSVSCVCACVLVCLRPRLRLRLRLRLLVIRVHVHVRVCARVFVGLVVGPPPFLSCPA